MGQQCPYPAQPMQAQSKPCCVWGGGGGFGVQGLGFGVQGFGFRPNRIWVLQGSRVRGLGFTVWGLVWDFGSGVGFEVRV